MIKKFEQKGTFEAYNAACKWLDDNGYSYGSSCAMSPTAIYKGSCYVSKWRNLSDKDKKELDGIMTGDLREGPVIIKLKSNK